MSPRRVVVCWPHPGLSGWRLQQYALLRTAMLCAEQRLYPGPGKVAVIATPGGIRDAAHSLAVSPHLLAQAVARANPGLWVDPLVAVACHVRDLNVLPVYEAAA